MSSICMLSVHGYFDAVPVLGRTDTGGQIVYVLELAKHLVKRNVKVDIFTRRFDDRAEVEHVAPGVRIVRIPCGEGCFIEKEYLYEHLGNFTDNMEEYIGRNDLVYDAFHSHYWDAGLIAERLTSGTEHFFIHTSHSLGALKKRQMPDTEETEKRFRFGIRIPNEKRIFRSARSIIASTPIEKEDYVKDYGVEPGKVRIIPPGVDTDRFAPRDSGGAKAALDLEDRSVVFSLSRIDSRKGLDLLIQGVREALNVRNDIVLVIGGGSKRMGADEVEVLNGLKGLAEDNDMRDKVVFTGYIPDDRVPVYYGAADVFVIPSRYEPFGLTILEAMSVGTPVIATKFGGPAHIITHGKDGFLVDPENPLEMGGTIVSLLRDETLRGKITGNGFDTIRSKYSWDSVVDSYLGHLEELR